MSENNIYICILLLISTIVLKKKKAKIVFHPDEAKLDFISEDRPSVVGVHIPKTNPIDLEAFERENDHQPLDVSLSDQTRFKKDPISFIPPIGMIEVDPFDFKEDLHIKPIKKTKKNRSKIDLKTL